MSAGAPASAVASSASSLAVVPGAVVSISPDARVVAAMDVCLEQTSAAPAEEPPSESPHDQINAHLQALREHRSETVKIVKELITDVKQTDEFAELRDHGKHVVEQVKEQARDVRDEVKDLAKTVKKFFKKW
jgi:hypothetical protein